MKAYSLGRAIAIIKKVGINRNEITIREGRYRLGSPSPRTPFPSIQLRKRREVDKRTKT